MGGSEQPTSVSQDDLGDQVQQLVGRDRRFFPSHLAIETVRTCSAKRLICPSVSMQRAKGPSPDGSARVHTCAHSCGVEHLAPPRQLCGLDDIRWVGW
jgi:hypothetical protein